MSLSYVYDSLALQYWQTSLFQMEQEYDPTGTDAIRNHYVIQGRGFLNYDASFPSGNSAVIIKALKARLEAPRRSFYYTIGGTTVVSVINPPDARLGPKPLPAKVTQVNSGMFFVECGVEVWTVNCDNDCDSRDPVVSLRWSQTESFDQNWYSRLKTKGLLIVRSDLRQNADNFRPLATPPLLPDYQRMGASYTMSPDGLQLEFEFDDQEVDRLPPGGTTKASGSYTVEVIKPGYRRIGTVSVSLEGPKGSSRDTLLTRAVQMCRAKLDADQFLKGADGTQPPVVWWGNFAEDLFEPKVSVTMGALMSTLPTGGLIDWAAAAAAAGAWTTPGVVKRPNVMPSVGQETFGLKSDQLGLPVPERKRLAGLLAAAFRDPCACLTATTELVSTGSEPFPPFNTSVVNPTPTSSVPATPPASIVIGIIGGAAGAIANGVIDYAPYNNYTIEAATVFLNGLLQMPATGVGSNRQVSRVVSESGPQTQLTISWVASRDGKPPDLPTFYSNDSNVIPLGGTVVASDVKPSVDGSMLSYMVSGFFRYAVLDPTKFNATAPVTPTFGPAVQSGALLGTAFWNAAPVWAQQQQATQTNPFEEAGYQEGDPQAAPAFQAGAAAGGLLGAVVGGGGTNNPQQDTGGGYFYPQVNP